VSRPQEEKEQTVNGVSGMSFEKVTERMMKSNEPLEGFCLKCRQNKTMVGILLTTLGNGTPAIRGTCPDCGTRIYKLLPKRSVTDQRKSARIGCDVKLKFRRLKTTGISSEEQSYYDAQAVNLSQTGMLLKVPCHLERGQLLDIYAVSKDPVSASVGIAKVMWEHEESGLCEAGISFILKQSL